MPRTVFFFISAIWLMPAVWAKPFNWSSPDPKTFAFQTCQDITQAYIQEPQAWVREKIMDTGSSVADKPCMDLLLTALRDEDFLVRRAAHRLILNLEKSSQEKLIRRALSFEHEAMVISTIQLIDAMPKSRWKSYVPVLMDVVKIRSSDAIRIEVCTFLLHHVPESLKTILSDPDPKVAQLTLYVLKHQRLQGPESEALIRWAATTRPDLFVDESRWLKIEAVMALVSSESSEGGLRRVWRWIQTTTRKVWDWIVG